MKSARRSKSDELTGRRTTHSSRLYEHLISTNETTDHWLGAVNGYLVARGGADDSWAQLTSIGMLARWLPSG